jgi:hypothetical protein
MKKMLPGMSSDAMTAPREGTWIRLASGDRAYGKWHISRGQVRDAHYSGDPNPRTRCRLLTRCGRYLEVDQVEPCTPKQGRLRRFHYLTIDGFTPSPACGACARGLR